MLTRFHCLFRKRLSEEDVREFFACQNGVEGNVASSIWKDVAHMVGLPWEKLRPADRIRYEIAGHPLDYFDPGYELEELALFFEEECKARGITTAFDEVNTLYELVVTLANGQNHDT